MPLTAKGEKIKKAMEKTYGPDKAEQVLYASKNAGTISGIDSASDDEAACADAISAAADAVEQLHRRVDAYCADAAKKPPKGVLELTPDMETEESKRMSRIFGASAQYGGPYRRYTHGEGGRITGVTKTSDPLNDAVGALNDAIEGLNRRVDAYCARRADEQPAQDIKDAATPKSFWTYQASTPTPTVAEAIKAGAVPGNTTQAEWEQLSPGMRRELLRGKRADDRRVIGGVGHVTP
jgi:hypothetical protein